MRLVFIFLICLLWPVPAVRAQEANPEDLVEIGDGMAVLHADLAAAEEEAIWDAKRNAVECAAGILLKSRAVGQGFTLESDRIEAQTGGFVRRWEIVPGSRRIETVGNGKILHVKVRAVVALLSVLRHLEDMKDVYNDLERPRIRVEITGEGPGHTAQNALIAALQAQGFAVAVDGAAEVVLSGRLEAAPTVRLGDKNVAYGVGESVAVCRARLHVQFLSDASEEALFGAQSEATGSSFQSDSDARTEASQAAAEALLEQDHGTVLQRLLARWCRERQEGHAVALQVSGIDAQRVALLRVRLQEMRGFRRFITESNDAKKTTLRFITRLDNRAVRRRLAELHLDNALLRVKSSRGPVIVCAASARSRTMRK